jgi:hypothetical protein
LVDQKTCPTARLSDVDAVQVFKDAVEVMEAASCLPIMARRLVATTGWKERLIHLFRAYGGEQRARLAWYREAGRLLDQDLSFRAFFEGETQCLPDVLRRQVLRRLGRWVEFLPPELSDGLRTSGTYFTAGVSNKL